MRAKVIKAYAGHEIGDVIEVTKAPGGTGNYHDEKRHLFWPQELEILPDEPPTSAAGGPAGATSVMRTFDTGATRTNDVGKLDYEGFLSPLVLERYAQYLNKHRVQADGAVRDSDNWQKGIPQAAYMKSAWRHFMDWWRMHRYNITRPYTVEQYEVTEEAICAVLFNAMGYLHEHLKAKVSANSEAK